MASPNDTTYSVVRETVAGTTPATPALANFDYISGSDLSYDGKMVTSDVMKTNRANAGAALMNKAGGGSLKTHGRKDSTTDMLIEAAVGGAFASKVAKGGVIDFSHTIEKKMVDGASAMYFRWGGAYVTKMGLTVDASSNAEFNFDFVTMNRSTGTAIVTGAVYSAATQGPTLTGNDVGVISIGGITGIYTSLDFSVEQSREAIFGLGTANAVGVGVSASPRMVKLTAKLLRKDLNVDAIAGTTVAVSFTIGTGVGNGYTFTMPSMVASIPQDEISGAAGVVSVDFIAVHNATLGTDFSVTQL